MEITPEKRVAFYTLGCKVNQYDTQAMLERFAERGYNVVDFDQTADVYVINTCTVTNLGDRKSRQMIRKAYRENPNAIIVAAGCYAQRDAQKVANIPGISLVIGNTERSRIVDLVEQVQKSGCKINAVKNVMQERKFEETPIGTYAERTRAVLKIQEGCNQFCTYCIIPYARGPVRSRHPENIRDEVVRLAESGFKEIVLTGIHIASYGKDLGDTDLLTLIKEIHDIKGVERIRLGSLEPTFITQEFIHNAKDLPKLCRHYHISLQSGSDKTLKRMGRRYSTHEYENIVRALRSSIPEVSITTDIMVGFPGETDREFFETLTFVENVAFSKIHVFQYSPREGTPAATFSNQVSSAIKEERSKRLIELGHKLEKSYMNSFIGKRVSVLFEQPFEGMDGLYEGYTDHYIKVVAQSDNDLHGLILPALVQHSNDDHVVGSIVIS